MAQASGICIAFEGQTWEVVFCKVADSTQLTLTCTVREDFPDEFPEFQPAGCIAGWEYFIQQNLKQYLDSRN